MDKLLTFVRIPKNASTSMYYHIHRINTIVDEDLPFLDKHHKIFAPSHCTLSQAVKTLGEEILKKIVFAVCRNPYDRMVSQFCFVQSQEFIPKKFKDFAEFVDFCVEEDTIASHSQSHYLDMDVNIDILRFERLKEDWCRFLSRHSLSINPILPRLNKTKRKNGIDYYTPSIKQKVAKMWLEDFRRFNYPM